MSLKTARFHPQGFMEKWGDGIALAGGAILVVGMLTVALARMPEHRVSERDFIELPAPSATSAPLGSKRLERIEPLPVRRRAAPSRGSMLAERP